VRSFAEVASTLLFLAALVHMPLANLSAIMQSLPLAVTLAAWAVFGDRVGWRRMTAILVGFVGVLIIVRPGPAGFDHYALLGLASVAFVVVRDLSTRELSKAVPSATVAVAASLSVTTTALVLSLPGGWVGFSLREGLLICGAAASLVVGYNFVVMVMRVGDIGFVAPVPLCVIAGGAGSGLGGVRHDSRSADHVRGGAGGGVGHLHPVARAEGEGARCGGCNAGMSLRAGPLTSPATPPIRPLHRALAPMGAGLGISKSEWS
jgi:hypothetical protein